MAQPSPTPVSVTLHQESHVLEIGYADGQTFRLPFELLRVYSPSAEVQGHGPSQRVLVPGKRNVNIAAIEPIGNYAVVLRFDDGHDSGIYSWSLLRTLGEQYDVRWARYLAELEERGASREP